MPNKDDIEQAAEAYDRAFTEWRLFLQFRKNQDRANAKKSYYGRDYVTSSGRSLKKLENVRPAYKK